MASFSSGASFQNRLPMGTAGTTPSKRSRARCFHEQRSASFITRCTWAGNAASGSSGVPARPAQ